jgi:hypothetical protein
MTESRRKRWTGHIALIKELRNPHTIKLYSKNLMCISLDKPRPKLEDNIETDMKERWDVFWLRTEFSGGSCEYGN